MQTIERATWTENERALWDRIERHAFERDDHLLDFTGRLARDRGWSLAFARGAVEAYRRFCFLAVVFDTPVTPSEEVDEVWHQHLTYSRDYWDAWCGQVLRARLHHDPTEGGPAEQARYREQYAQTLARHEAYFGPPDPLYWPGTRDRFRGRARYRIVDADRYVMLPRLRLGARPVRIAAAGGLALATLIPQPAHALPDNPLDWTGPSFLALYAALLVAAFIVIYAVREGLRRNGSASPRADDLGVVELAFLAGGYERAGDAVIIGLVDFGAASFSARTGLIAIERTDTPPPGWLQPYIGMLHGPLRRSLAVKALKPRLASIRNHLVRDGLAPDERMLRAMTIATLAILLPVFALGLAKMAVGLSRDKPIGFLVMFTLFAIVGLIAVLRSQPTRTSRGDAVLARYRQRYSRAIRAPQSSEIPFALALGGTAALAATPYADYARAANNSGSSSGCGGSGDGGGGGGCGGCGGGGGD